MKFNEVKLVHISLGPWQDSRGKSQSLMVRFEKAFFDQIKEEAKVSLKSVNSLIRYYCYLYAKSKHYPRKSGQTLAEQIEDIAKNRETSKSDIVREAVSLYLPGYNNR